MRFRRAVLFGVLAVLVTVDAALAERALEVRQKNRAFNPGVLEINRGDIVRIINDDGELLHHAYVSSPGFNFDSGEQEPGSTTDIRFTKAGTFTVLCAIHPKMHLAVTVH
jgi:plastocyanin